MDHGLDVPPDAARAVVCIDEHEVQRHGGGIESSKRLANTSAASPMRRSTFDGTGNG